MEKINRILKPRTLIVTPVFEQKLSEKELDGFILIEAQQWIYSNSPGGINQMQC